ncbi:cytochrome c [Nitrogeniibacter mangrovi]|uniref:Cytochrome c n=1 Tax=Nitrogeniibacter mangrovi TaxID=2016596 RepID=A0A6C1B8Q0_9RHOO|nr:cytochrome c [Nitrogeniibacter mangrovi]QID19108.1 cytochrome c [Nitrogeniibacter mangrovi]
MKVDRIALLHVAVLIGITALAVGTARAEPQGERRVEIISMVRQDCGSCHGMTLKGGLGPSLLPEALAHKPAASLVAVIMNGRPGTAMPGWSRFVSESEAEWIVARLRQGFPHIARQESGQ